MLRIKPVVLAILIAFFVLIPTETLKAFPKTAQDFLLLPPYCSARYGRTNEADAARWAKIIGREFWRGIHHYCSGLDLINKANRTTNPAEKKILFGKAYGVINAYTGNVGPRWMPEVSLKKGIALAGYGDVGAAIQEFTKAIRLRPDYTQAYLALSKTYLDLGDKTKAREFLELGLEKKPNSKSIKRALSRLD
ncbi:tetratricopeptide repeat protein [Gammaproteobacteria bacterium]|nr:tetratricopeptide repeat protein [Gammaproteobacteria bacterium]